MTRCLTILAATTALTLSASSEPPNFASDIQPLLTERCVKCHGAEKTKGGLRLDFKAAAFRGGDSGEPGIVPGDASRSRLFQMVSSEDEDERMPPKQGGGEPLDPTQLDLLRSWIAAGAEWPESEAKAEATAAKLSRAEMKVTGADRQHWSFRPLAAVVPPKVKGEAWVRTPVDAFIGGALEAQGIPPSEPADARTLVRRIFFDLIGLPPTPEQMATWTSRISESRANVSALVDALLLSPHYGERWARHWLDVARYADSNGQEGDDDRPNAYHFRDFVIRALNDDLPFNTFVQWQLAGDEIVPDNPQAIAATGFIVAGNSTILDVPMEEEKLRNRANELDDMVSTTSQAMLGLTLACARCHDHKYDPFPTRDYYRLMRIFNSGDRKEVPLAPPDAVTAHRDALAAWQAEFDPVVKERDEWLNRFKKEPNVENADFVKTLPPEQKAHWDELDARVKAVAKRKPAKLPTAFAFADFAPEPRETWFFERGDFMARNEKMDLGFISVLMNGKTAEDYWRAAKEARLRDDSTQQRRALAEWITDLEHGAGTLLARVMVNRVWQNHFGEGLVRTASDFGTRGELPTHPELLEWLTGELITSGWSLKHLHRLIVNSATYQQAAAFDGGKAAADPDNRLLWRSRPRRLESEILRDSMLSVAATLNTAMFGPSFKPPIAAEAVQARNVKNPYPKDAKDTSETRKRTVYMFHKRVVQYPLMQAFDAPDAQTSCGRRMNTTVAPQALALLNDPFVRLRAAELAKRLQAEAGADSDTQIRHAFQLCLGRQPEHEELDGARAFLLAQVAARRERDTTLPSGTVQQLALTDFCQCLFGLNEFIYID